MNLQLRKDIAEAYHSNPQKIRVMNFFLTEMIEKRKPLREGGKARRLDWTQEAGFWIFFIV